MRKNSGKKWIAAAAGMLLAAAFSVNAYAGQWNYDEQRGAWNYTADDGSHPVNQWLLIDSDGD
ncbi:MAG: hypothetical protein K6E83_05370, partial [Clostridium sp.]|nr:hypothetical protein [Clostridium sp.]